MTDFKNKVHQLVSVFYPQTFKTFFINSEDGKTLCQPIGVFVSLGITTSMNVLNNILGAINGSNDMEASLVEIGSKKDEGIFINYLVSKEPKQYRIENTNELLGKEEAQKKLEELEGSIEEDAPVDEVQKTALLSNRLKSLITKLEETGGWNDHAIQEDEQGFRIYHLNVNYKKEDDIEYRIGILVNEKN